MNQPTNYLPVLMQAAVAIGFVGLVLSLTFGITRWLKYNKNNNTKDDNFECGIEAQGNARVPFSVKYFMTAILFVLFDVEVIFFYPYAVNFKSMGWDGFLAVLMFVSFFLCGFFYVLKKGALEWDK
jgi:NADH-quinone oxidoreductase subunit A